MSATYSETDWLYAAWRVEQDTLRGIALDERRAHYYRQRATDIRRLAEQKNYSREDVAMVGRSDECAAEVIESLVRARKAAA